MTHWPISKYSVHFSTIHLKTLRWNIIVFSFFHWNYEHIWTNIITVRTTISISISISISVFVHMHTYILTRLVHIWRVCVQPILMSITNIHLVVVCTFFLHRMGFHVWKRKKNHIFTRLELNECRNAYRASTNNRVTMIIKTKQPEKKIKAIANDKRQHAK